VTIIKLHHVAIVVEHLDEALKVYRDALGLPLARVDVMEEQDVKMAFLPSGDSEIELLEPIHAESGIGRYLAKRGEGMHHICLEVDDLSSTLAELKAGGAQLIDETPRRGADGWVAFIHPKGAHGVLVELVQTDDASPDAE
jgi:methylmalonyl-CoA/ethylmalonyl-CoA epimerase